MPSYINSMVHLSNKSSHRGSPISGSRNCSSDTKLSKLCPVDVLTLFVLRKALLSVCIGFFSYSPACSSHGIDGYQTLIDQTRPAFTTPVESVSRKEVPGQAVLSQQASWTNQILSEHPKGKVDFLFLESSTSAFMLWNLFSSCVPTRKKKKTDGQNIHHQAPEWITLHRTLDISCALSINWCGFEASCKLS